MKKHGFDPFLSNAYVFRNSNSTIIVIYVDDLLIFARLLASVKSAAQLIGGTFEMRSLGELHYYLGMRIMRNRARKQLMVTQDGYLDMISKKYATHLHNPIYPHSTPLGKNAAGLRQAAKDHDSPKKLKELYQSLVSSTVSLAMITRPDVCFEVGLCCRFLKNPTKQHLEAIVTVLEYLITTKARGMLFQGNGTGELQLMAFTDASWADDVDTRRSTGGMLFKLAGAPLFYKSGRQTVVALSSTEAEYIQLSLVAKEANYLMRLLDECGYKGKLRPLTIREDNKPAIDITKRSSTNDGRTKHIDLRYRFIQQEIALGNVEVTWISTHEQAADGLTKALDKVKHAEFVKQLGLVDCSQAIAAQKDSQLLHDKVLY
jgi:hypothetical protein